MEIEAGLYMLLRQGPYHNSCLTLGGSEHLQPTLPQCTFIHTHPAWYLQCTGQQWAGQRINGFTSMYKICTHRNNEREGNRNYPNGDMTKDVSTRSSTYIKTLANKEKFPY